MLTFVSGLAASRSYLLLALISAVVIGPAMLPVEWSGNEIVYYDLAWRAVRPGAFTDAFSMFDADRSRIAGMAFIGLFIDLLGFEAAKTVLSLLCWLLYALALAAVARGLGMRVAETGLALLVFMLAEQELVGGEWVFGTVETKVLAYICILFGLALALRGRWLAAILSAALATLFHFLVGGAWAMFLLLLHVLRGGRPASALRLLALYAVLVSPVVAVLLYERIGVTVDLSGFVGTMDQIYANIRAPHHVAPFAAGWRTFVLVWVPGLLVHFTLAVVLFWAMRGSAAADRTLLRWAGILNLLLLAVTILAFLDRNADHLAKFLMFRPSSLVLLLSCLLLARRLMPAAGALPDEVPAASALALVLVLLFPGYLTGLGTMALKIPPGARLEAQMTEDERDILGWISGNTPNDAAILVEPPGGVPSLGAEQTAFPAGLERLTRRGFIVNFKNVPADMRDMARWYRLILARTAFFGGDCGQLAQLGADYVVFRDEASLDRLAACQSEVYRNGTFIVARTVSG